MFCGSCMHDNTWARALMDQGVEVSLIPTYSPIRVDEEDVSGSRIFFGGINVYLASKWKWWRKVPSFLKNWLNHPAIINLATRRTVSNDAAQLGQLTLDMLAGESGPMCEQVEELAKFLGEQLRPDIIIFSNALLAGAVQRIKQLFAGPVLCLLQGDDIFLDSLPSSHRESVLQALRDRVRDFDGFITHSHYYAKHMAEVLQQPVQRTKAVISASGSSENAIGSAEPMPSASPGVPFHILPLGIDLAGHDGAPHAANDPFTVGYFARICPEKGLHILVDAFLRLHDKHPGTRLRVGGFLGERDRQYFEGILAQAAPLGTAFDFVGSPVTHAEKVAFLKSLDVFSVPTIYREPKGISILEALANGVPVVQPSHGAFPELIESTRGGLLFHPGNVGEFTLRLTELILDDSLRISLGRDGQKRIQQHFSADVLAIFAVKLFRSILERQTASDATIQAETTVMPNA